MKNDIYLTENGELLREMIMEGKTYLQNYMLEGKSKANIGEKIILIGNMKDEPIRKFYGSYRPIDQYMKGRKDQIEKIQQQVSLKKTTEEKGQFIDRHLEVAKESIKEMEYNFNNLIK